MSFECVQFSHTNCKLHCLICKSVACMVLHISSILERIYLSGPEVLALFHFHFALLQMAVWLSFSNILPLHQKHLVVNCYCWPVSDFNCILAASMASAISVAFFKVKSVSASSHFCVFSFLNPETNRSLNAVSKKVSNLQCSFNFLKTAI